MFRQSYAQVFVFVCQTLSQEGHTWSQTDGCWPVPN